MRGFAFFADSSGDELLIAAQAWNPHRAAATLQVSSDGGAHFERARATLGELGGRWRLLDFSHGVATLCVQRADAAPSLCDLLTSDADGTRYALSLRDAIARSFVQPDPSSVEATFVANQVSLSPSLSQTPTSTST